MKCILCEDETEGSIGVAGIKWKTICQNCKDKEDNALSNKIKYQAEVYGKIAEALKQDGVNIGVSIL